jgi:hypothetical protein
MADTTNLLAGTAYLTLDGKSVMLVGSFEYRPTNATRETLKGMDGIHGFKETPEAGMIKATLRDNGAISVQELGAATDISVVAQLANGKTIIGRNMWRVGDPPAVNTDEGTFDIQWEGLDVTEN